ncbi:MAG TPA: glycoside hydrolase family 19 protein, partial [Pseudoxanthomonas sp.]|nr:glycoside hydrolase family 19 protein [Pseudoxanthomonas sp.]
QAIVEPIRETCRQYEIDTAARLAAFLAQAGHESASFTRVRENLNYSADGLVRTWPSRFTRALAQEVAYKPEAIARIAYGNRLGNHDAADGWRYIGRGYIQVTGRANYAGMTETLRTKAPSAPDFEAHPELLEEPRWAALSAGAYWNDHDLNELADRGDFDRITARINGGQTGKADRRARYSQAIKVLGS